MSVSRRRGGRRQRPIPGDADEDRTGDEVAAGGRGPGAGAGQQAIGQQARVWATLEGHISSVVSLAFTPDGRMLASGSFDGTARLWEVASGRLRATLQKHADGVTRAILTPTQVATLKANLPQLKAVEESD